MVFVQVSQSELGRRVLIEKGLFFEESSTIRLHKAFSKHIEVNRVVVLFDFLHGDWPSF